MKHYYYFVRNLNGFSSDDVVYKVAVGSSMREHVKFELVNQYAKDCGMYFRLVSVESDCAISQLAKNLFTGTLFSEMHLRRANISIAQLYEMIIDDSFVFFESSLTESSSKIQLLNLISPSFRYQNSHPHCDTTCQPYRRKYLSHGKGSLNTQVLIGFCLILVLFMLSGYLEGIERCTY